MKQCSGSSVKALVIFTAGILCLNLAACSSDGEVRDEYQQANSLENLEIPPKLSAPDTRSAMRIPEPSEMAQAAAARNKMNAIESIAPDFDGMALKNNGQFHWLEIDKPVEEVWGSLTRFLDSEGIETTRVDKLMGIVDTKWMDEFKDTFTKNEDSGWFSAYTPVYKDRFRLRIKAIDKNKTKLVISHRGLMETEFDDRRQWVERSSEAFLEREIVYRYMLFSGITENTTRAVLSSYQSYQSRVREDAGKPSEFQVKGEAKTVWLRLVMAMDRLGVDTVKSNQQAGTLEIVVDSADAYKSEEEQGWFDGLFSSDSAKDEKSDSEDDSHKIADDMQDDSTKVTLIVQQIEGNHISTIKISNKDGSSVEDGQAQAFRDSLIKQLN